MNKETQHIDNSIIAKFLSGDASTSEIDAVLNWVNLSDENIQKFKQLEKVWTLSNLLKRKPFDADKAWHKFNRQINKRRNLQLIYSGVAAAIIIFAVIFTQTINTEKHTVTPQFAMSSSDKPINTILPDGSNILLAEKSNIKYQLDTLTNTRTAYLSGGAFFDVKHDSIQKFIVETQYGGVEVLGTQFNVNVLKNTDVQIDVLSGKVKLFLPQISGDTLFLIITNNETAVISMRSNSINKETQKPSVFYNLNKTLVFNNIDLKTIINELEECYKVKIETDSTINKALKFTSSFKDNTLEEILTIITQTHKLSFSKKDGIYTIKNNEE